MHFKNTIITLFAVSLAAGMGYYIGTERNNNTITQTPATNPPQISETIYPTPPEIPIYTIKEYEGKIAVFMGEKQKPEIVFDRYVHLLPDLDRKEIREGVIAEDYETLLSLIEDYTS